jgi:DNA primase
MSQIREIKEANNIVEIIGERIKLEPSGINFKACCPFHNEKTPSFFVHPGMQRYRCFGCGASGDVLDFLQNYEGVTFYEALKILADRAGIEVKEFQKSQEDEERDKLLEILNLAKEYYHYLLTDHKAGQVGRDYLKDRGTTAESIKLFQLGYSIDSWDSLINYLHKKKKYNLDLIAKTGLIIKGRGGRYYDRFRGRLIFPLKNHRGQVVGFSGRILQKDAKEAKYINSPETLLYHKSKMLYGYSELFREIKKKEKVIVVEGEFDMISSTQAHVNNVVAIKGSALTEDQVSLLSRVAKTIVLSLDADSAGIKASKRAIEIVKDKDLDLRVIDLKHLDFISKEDETKDPDDLARENPKLWRRAVDEAVSAYQFLLDTALDSYDSSSPDGKRKIINELAPMIKSISHAVEKEFYLQKLSEALNVKQSLLKEDIEKFGVKKDSFISKGQEEKTEIKHKTYQEKNEEYLLFLTFKFSGEQLKEKIKAVSRLELQTIGAKQIFEALNKWKQDFDLEKFSSILAEDLKEILIAWVLNPEYEKLADQIKLEAEWQQLFAKVEKEVLRTEIGKINQEISDLDAKLKRDENEEKRLDELLALIIQKQQEIKKLSK